MAKLLRSNSKSLMNNFLIRSPSTSSDNIDNEPFLLVLYLCKYGEFEPNEIEVRINNLYMEIKGEQKWRMADGGADSRTFTLRHVLPDNVDLNSMYCRLVDQNLTTLVISAKKTPGTQPKVDYTLAFNESGVQYLKSYNLNKDHDSSIRSETTTTQDKQNDNNDATKMLFNLISKSSAKNKSKLFTNIQGQENLNLANNLRTQEKTSTGPLNQNRIRLTIDQLMNSEKKETTKKKKSKRTRSKSKKKDNQNDDKSECTDDKQKEPKQRTPKKEDNQMKINKSIKESMKIIEESMKKSAKESVKSNFDKMIEESIEKLKLISDFDTKIDDSIVQVLNENLKILELPEVNKTNEKDNQTKKQIKSKEMKFVNLKDNLTGSKDKNEMANLLITDLLDGNFVYGNDIVKEQKNSQPDDQTSSSSSISLLNECTNHLINDQTKSIDKNKVKLTKKEKHVTIIDDKN